MEYPGSTPTVLVVFGATGDLMARKIVPSLYHLNSEGLLPPRFRVVGFSRRDWSADDLRAHVREIVGAKYPSANDLEEFYGMKPMVRGDLYIGFLRVLRDDLPADPDIQAEGLVIPPLTLKELPDEPLPGGKALVRGDEPPADQLEPSFGDVDKAVMSLDEGEVKKQTDEICDKLLANPNIETYRFTVERR